VPEILVYQPAESRFGRWTSRPATLTVSLLGAQAVLKETADTVTLMRRLLFACALVALLVPAVALAADLAPGDGTLSVKNGTGRIDVAARGAVIGSCERCTITIDDPKAGDGTGPIVSGAEAQLDLTDTKSRWTGTDIRFRLIGGFSRVIVTGSGIELSAVGQGSATVRGWLNNLGTYAVNGADRKLLPFEPDSFRLGEPTGE
jgi:hypothetical protein